MQLIYRRFPLIIAVLGLLLASAGTAFAQGMYLEDDGGAEGPQIEELSVLDLRYMDNQRTLLQELAATSFGRRFNGERDNDLEVLQLLLDRGVVSNQQTAELQAMGIVIGDLLAIELDMQWVVYADGIGRSRALRYRDSDDVVFPVTMISRRREVGNEDLVIGIYAQARDKALAQRPPRPFQ